MNILRTATYSCREVQSRRHGWVLLAEILVTFSFAVSLVLQRRCLVLSFNPRVCSNIACTHSNRSLGQVDSSSLETVAHANSDRAFAPCGFKDFFMHHAEGPGIHKWVLLVHCFSKVFVVIVPCIYLQWKFDITR